MEAVQPEAFARPGLAARAAQNSRPIPRGLAAACAAGASAISRSQARGPLPCQPQPRWLGQLTRLWHEHSGCQAHDQEACGHPEGLVSVKPVTVGVPCRM